MTIQKNMYANSSIYNTIYGIDSFKSGSQSGGLSKNDFIKLLANKKQFLVYTFGNLVLQLFITFILFFNITSKMIGNNMFIPLIIASFIIILILALVPMPPIMKFMVFTLFSITIGLMLVFIKNDVNENIIKAALVGVLAIFFVMFLFGVILILFDINLGFGFGLFLLLCLLIVIIFMIISHFMGAYSKLSKGISIVILLLFSVYIIYDTNSILQRNYYGDFITASLDYYLDIINIFINLINLQR